MNCEVERTKIETIHCFNFFFQQKLVQYITNLDDYLYFIQLLKKYKKLYI